MHHELHHPALEQGTEVFQALAGGKPVVALESTIISHGMPYPQNLETALRVQEEVRTHGAVPATIAVMGGRLKVGLSEPELETLARTGPDAIKCSRRDLPVVLDRGLTGATTVAATMIVAQLAGIEIFATGGIGGVHRGAELSMDISADLQELARTSVAVVCAGPKSILDIALTLEYLETQGVPVIGFGTDVLPAFFTRKSDFAVDYRMDSAADVAQMLRTKWSLGLAGGAVIANPVPEADAMPAEEIRQLIDTAIQEADRQGIGGKQLTPFLLSRVEQLSSGASLKANISLVLNNARVAAAIAVALVKNS